MQFSTSITYPAPLATVQAMLRDERFYRIRAELAESRLASLEVAAPGDGSTVVTSVVEADVASFSLPPAILRWLPTDQLRFTTVESFNESGVGKLQASVEGIPASLEAITRLQDEGESTTRQVEGTVSVKVPLLGGKLEKMAVAHLGEVVRAEEKAARRYLDA